MESPYNLFTFIRPCLIVLLIFFSGFFEAALAKKIITGPRLHIKNLSDSSVIVINNKKMSPDLLGYCLISPGLNTIQIERGGIVRYSTSFVFNDKEEHSLSLDCSGECASLDIVTEPFGASVSLNGKYSGMTPYFNGFIKPGEYILTVTHRGYNPINDTISTTQGKPSMLTLTLEPSAAYRDSMLAMKYTKKRSRQFVQKALFGSLAALLAGTAIYYDRDARHKLSLADQNAAGYDQARSNFGQYRSEYLNNRDGARQAMGTRNILYYAATACMFGVSFSFFF